MCKHDWIGDDNCAYCRIEYLEYALSQTEERIREQAEEIEILRQWGNKDCTAMADKELTKLRVAALRSDPRDQNEPDNGIYFDITIGDNNGTS